MSVDGRNGYRTPTNKVGDMADTQTVQTPCIGVCLLDEQDLCIGCRRSLDEIANWSVYTDDQRQALLNKLDKR